MLVCNSMFLLLHDNAQVLHWNSDLLKKKVSPIIKGKSKERIGITSDKRNTNFWISRL